MFENINWPVWFRAVYITGGGLVLQYVLIKLVFPLLKRKRKSDGGPSARAILLDALEKPARLVIIISSLYAGLSGTPLYAAVPATLDKVCRSFLIAAFFYMFYNLSGNRRGHLTNLAKHFDFALDPILSNILSSVLHVLILIIGFLTLAKEWNYDVSGMIAGLGLGGLALAMASKDSLANIFGGFIILLDKPFGIGDWIQTAGIEGAVEAVSFRSTRIRTTEQALVHIPNSNLTNVAIANFSRRGKRRASLTIGLAYATAKKQLADCVAEIRAMLAQNSGLSQKEGDNVVAFSEYGDSSLNISVVFFTLATDYTGYLSRKEEVNFAVMDIVEKLGLDIAFPSQSVYFETPLATLAKNDEKTPCPAAKLP
ncbi:MAG: mechanosensitive ion channel family protein [Acidaminococcales bacterium]|nr:mechanosensitive ion channel family protein [Acidaminococcales bacterium]